MSGRLDAIKAHLARIDRLFPRAVALRCYGEGTEPILREWLQAVWDSGFHHGSKLVHAMGDATRRAGSGGNVADAGDLLVALVGAGWIKPGKHSEPTTSQRAFAGLQYRGNVQRGWSDRVDASHFGFEPVRSSRALILYLFEDHPRLAHVLAHHCGDPAPVCPRCLGVSPGEACDAEPSGPVATEFCAPCLAATARPVEPVRGPRPRARGEVLTPGEAAKERAALEAAGVPTVTTRSDDPAPPVAARKRAPRKPRVCQHGGPYRVVRGMRGDVQCMTAPICMGCGAYHMGADGWGLALADHRKPLVLPQDSALIVLSGPIADLDEARRIAAEPPPLAPAAEAVPAVASPSSAVDWAREMATLRETKPRGLRKRFGKDPTPAQVQTHALDVRNWNKAYRHASRAWKDAAARERDETRVPVALAPAPAPAPAAEPIDTATNRARLAAEVAAVEAAKPARPQKPTAAERIAYRAAFKDWKRALRLARARAACPRCVDPQASLTPAAVRAQCCKPCRRAKVFAALPRAIEVRHRHSKAPRKLLAVELARGGRELYTEPTFDGAFVFDARTGDGIGATRLWEITVESMRELRLDPSYEPRRKPRKAAAIPPGERRSSQIDWTAAL